MAGIMQAVNIIAILTSLDGSEEDLDKVLAIETIAESHRKKDGDGDDE